MKIIRVRGTLLRTTAIAGVLSLVLSGGALAQGATYTFDIPAESLAGALQEVAKVSGKQIIFADRLTAGKYTAGLHGSFTVDEAMNRLLSGTDLAASEAGSGGIIVKSKNAQAASNEGAAKSPMTTASTLVESVVVTGTNINGVSQIAAPSQSITRAQIEQAGFGSSEDVFRSLPGNFADLNVSGSVATGGTSVANSNLNEGSVGVDLDGLGPQATLVLVNGQRQAANLYGQVVDISSIPLSAIDRIDIVSGGGSAIYGSDAVAGVVNIILRKSFDGALSQAYAGSDEHGGQRVQASQTFGIESANAGFIASYDFERDWSLDLAKTSLLMSPTSDGSTITHRFDVVPDRWRHSVLLSGHYDPTQDLELTLDANFTFNQNKHQLNYTLVGCCDVDNSYNNTNQKLDVTAAAKYSVGSDWIISATANHSNIWDGGLSVTNYVGISTTPELLNTAASVDSISVISSGTLAEIGSVQIHSAAGGELRWESLSAPPNTGMGSGIHGYRSVRSAFAEMSASLIKDGTTPGIRNVELSAAGRFDSYSDFGSTFNPQGGIIWDAGGGLTIKGNYARAFRAPDLYSLASDTFLDLYKRPPTIGATATAPVLEVDGGNAALRPETANTWTVGSEYSPDFASWSKLSISYFNITYRNRIGVSAQGNDIVNVLGLPQYATLVNLAPSATYISSLLAGAQYFQNIAKVAFGPCPKVGLCTPTSSAILAAFPTVAVFNNSDNNLAAETVDGINLSANADYPTAGGNVLFGLTTAYTLDHTRTISATSAASEYINLVGKPVGMRLRGDTGFRSGPYSLIGYINYTDGYSNPYSAPASHISSWTTFDLSLQFDGNALEDAGPLKDVGVTLSVQNLFDKDPPAFLQNAQGERYDSANANPLGRIVSFRVSKSW